MVAKTGALPTIDESKLVTKSSVTLRRQFAMVNDVFCRTKRPVDATVSRVIKKEFVMAMATGQ